jgi:predicted Zn finger-like uncharacterized protein
MRIGARKARTNRGEGVMRLVCPACGAAYEAPEGAIPEAGRWVRCSACRAEWMARPAAAPSPKAPPAETAAPEPHPAGRAGAVAPGSAPAVEDPAFEFADGPAPARGAPRGLGQPPEDGAAPEVTPPRQKPPAGAAMAHSFDDEEKESRGSAAVMALVACLGLVGLAAALSYLRHDAIAAAAPQLAEPLAAYVEFVDDIRMRLGVDAPAE